MRRPWIKIEVATPDKPEICSLAQRLRLDEDAVVGKLVRFWSWVAQNRLHGEDLGVTVEFLDRLVGKRGFGEAMVEVRWLSRSADGRLGIPHFDRHNSDLARNRALTKQRVAKHRASKSETAEAPAPVKRGRSRIRSAVPPEKSSASAPEVAAVSAPKPASVAADSGARPPVALPEQAIGDSKGPEGAHWLDQPMLF